MALVPAENVFERLLQNMVDMEDEKDKALVDYFPREPEKQAAWRQTLSEYIRRLEELLKNMRSQAEKALESPVNLPFVIVGSRVEVAEEGTEKKQWFRLIRPYKYLNSDEMEVSYISPIGSALLMRHPGESVEVQTPDGAYRCRIGRIEL